MQNTSNGMATASLVLGIIGILTIFFGGSVILGALAIILALLSRGSGSMSRPAGIGMGLGIAGILLGIFVIISMFAYVFTSSDAQEMYRDYLQYYEDEMNGNDYYYDYGYDEPVLYEREMPQREISQDTCV